MTRDLTEVCATIEVPLFALRPFLRMNPLPDAVAERVPGERVGVGDRAVRLDERLGVLRELLPRRKEVRAAPVPPVVIGPADHLQ